MITQLIGLIAFIFLLTSFFQKEKKNILIYQIFSNSFYFVHYLYLAAQAGSAISVINVIKSFVFILKEKYKILNSKIVLFFFILTYCILCIYTFNGCISLLPYIAIIIYTSMLFQGSKNELLIGMMISSLLWIIYNFNVQSYIGVIAETVLFISNAAILYKNYKIVKNYANI